MGSWGYEPSDNDGSWDLLNLHIDAAAVAALKQMFASPKSVRPLGRKWRNETWWRWERVGVVQLVSERYDIQIPLTIALVVVRDLRSVLRDDYFMLGFRDPFVAWGTIETLIAAIEKNIVSALVASAREHAKATKSRRGSFSRRRFGPVLIYGPIFGYETKYMARMLEHGVGRSPIVRKTLRKKAKVRKTLRKKAKK